jgi:23S rRNA (guanine745-N1)-methyltransferase
MVAARASFLAAGHYAPLASALADVAAVALRGAERPVVLDAGAGTGYYLAAVLRRLRAAAGAGAAGAAGAGAAGLAMDISARALRHAARAAPGIGAVGWDTWQPFPVRSAAVSLILNVFAPRNGPEFHRVLRPGGALLVATPAGGHLAELAAVAGLLSVDEHKDDRLATTLGPYFTVASRQELAVPLRLTRTEATTLIAMGPSAWHTNPAETRAQLTALPEPVPVTAAFDVTLYRRR